MRFARPGLFLVTVDGNWGSDFNWPFQVLQVWWIQRVCWISWAWRIWRWGPFREENPNNPVN